MSDIRMKVKKLKGECICARCRFHSQSPLNPMEFYCWQQECVDMYAEGVVSCEGFKPEKQEAGQG